ncbi:MAG: PH domain-containing protein [Candidatus Binatia bacterium]
MGDAVYRSKVDEWLLVVFAVAALAAVGASIGLVLYGSYTEWIIAAGALLVGVGLPSWIMFTTHYTLTTGFLVIHSGPFHWSVPLRQIRSVTFTNSMLSSPALSLDRLRIEYSDNRAIMISPEDRRQFLAELKSRGVNVA